MKKCIICNAEKEDMEFKIEHAIANLQEVILKYLNLLNGVFSTMLNII